MESNIDERKGFRDLRVWQDAMKLASEVIKQTKSLPLYERQGLGLQLRRSAISVPSNIAEGWGRNGSREFRHFLDIANGSVCEAETQLELAARCYDMEVAYLINQCNSVRKQINALRRHLDK